MNTENIISEASAESCAPSADNRLDSCDENPAIGGCSLTPLCRRNTCGVESKDMNNDQDETTQSKEVEMTSSAPTSTPSGSEVFADNIKGKQIIYVATVELIPHPKNDEIYGNDCDAEFVESVKRNGIYTPLIVTKDLTVISGHRRLCAAIKTGIAELPVVILDDVDDLKIREGLIENNRQRVKNNEQIGREYIELRAIEEERIKLAKAASADGGGAVQNFTPAKKEKTRDKVGGDLGRSGVTLAKCADVIGAIDALKSEGKDADATSLRSKLNDGSIYAAYKMGRDSGHIKPKIVRKPKETPQKPPTAEPRSQKKGNDDGRWIQSRIGLLANEVYQMKFDQPLPWVDELADIWDEKNNIYLKFIDKVEVPNVLYAIALKADFPNSCIIVNGEANKCAEVEPSDTGELTGLFCPYLNFFAKQAGIHVEFKGHLYEAGELDANAEIIWKPTTDPVLLDLFNKYTGQEAQEQEGKAA